MNYIITYVVFMHFFLQCFETWFGDVNGIRPVKKTMCCGHFLCCYFVLFVCFDSWLFWLGCQYQCNWLTGKTHLRNDL